MTEFGKYYAGLGVLFMGWERGKNNKIKAHLIHKLLEMYSTNYFTFS